MNVTINLAEFGGVIAALLIVGGILKNAFPNFPNRLIPLLTWILGVIAYLALSGGWSNAGQWIAAIVAAATATGTHSSVKNTLQSGIDNGPADKITPPLGLWLLFALGFAFTLAGCATTPQRPPSNTELKYYEVKTNTIAVVSYVTNTIPATETNAGSVTVLPVTNVQETYTFTPNQNAGAVQNTGGSIGNFWGVGPIVAGVIGLLFGGYGMLRSRQADDDREGALLAAEELAQIIETGRQILLTLPNGAQYEREYKDWMIKHQADTEVIGNVATIVKTAVDRNAAKGAAQTIVNLIQATKPAA